MPTLAEIKSKPIAGNAYHDMPIINALDDFICDTTQSMDERKEAYKYLSENVMGLEVGEVTEEMIDEMIAS